MPSLLVLQFRKRPEMVEEEQEIFHREVRGNAELSFMNTFTDAVDWERPDELLAPYNGVILAGSGEFDFDGGRDLDDPQRTESHTLFQHMMPFLERVLARDFPTLGICYGHQVLAKAAGAEVVHDEDQAKVGTYRVLKHENAADDPLFAHLPESFPAQYGHKDSLMYMPHQAVLLARSEQCHFGGLRYGENVYSVQFHPELNGDDMIHRLRNSPGYLPDEVDVGDVVEPAPHAATVLERFITTIVGR